MNTSIFGVRITSRPWMADPYMKELLDTLVFDSRSIANKIKYSPLLSDKFNEYCKLAQDTPACGERRVLCEVFWFALFCSLHDFSKHKSSGFETWAWQNIASIRFSGRWGECSFGSTL